MTFVASIRQLQAVKRISSFHLELYLLLKIRRVCLRERLESPPGLFMAWGICSEWKWSISCAHDLHWVLILTSLASFVSAVCNFQHLVLAVCLRTLNFAYFEVGSLGSSGSLFPYYPSNLAATRYGCYDHSCFCPIAFIYAICRLSGRVMLMYNACSWNHLISSATSLVFCSVSTFH